MSSPSWSFFTPGSNPLLDYGHQLVAGAGFSQLAVGAVILAMCLGYAAYTDIFRGMVIPNSLNLGLWLAGIAASPLLFKHPFSHLVAAAVVTVLVFVIYLTPAFAEGDLKLYAAMAAILGWGALVVMLVSWFIIVAYSLPAMARKHRARLAGADSGMTKMPAGPGIALAFPVTLYLAQLKAGYCIELALIEVGMCVLALLFSGLNRLAEQAERAAEEAELAAVTHPLVVEAEEAETSTA